MTNPVAAAVAARPAIVGLLGLVALLLSGACASSVEPTRDDSGAIAEPEENADVFSLQVGDCLAKLDEFSGEFNALPVVPCEQEHAAEIYAATELPDGDFPGTAAVDEHADTFCSAEFEPFVGMPYERSELTFYALKPTSASWQDGDRELQCLVADPEQLVTGSLRDAAR